jgi:CrcB protein
MQRRQSFVLAGLAGAGTRTDTQVGGVNPIASALLGFLAALPGDSTAGGITGAAFCEAFAVYSTFGYETFRLAQDRAWLFAALIAATRIIAALGAAYVGMAIAWAITR